MSKTTLFDEHYTRSKRELLQQVLERLRPMYTPEEAAALRIDPVDPGILSQRSGRGFVNRDILETVLGNLLECVAPGSHNALDQQDDGKADLSSALGELADQLYAMIAQSFQTVEEVEDLEEKSLMATFALLWRLPELKQRSMWNRFAALKDPAVWDAYLMHRCGLTPDELSKLDVGACVDETIRQRDLDHYRSFLQDLQCSFILNYQMQLVMSTYPGWRVLLYHEVANALTKAGPVDGNDALESIPVPLLSRAIAELGARYYQADIHPETEIGDANFLDHTHRGLTTGQTGVIGCGCHIMPCTLGGLTRRLRRRHPLIGDYVIIGTDADLLGPVGIGDRSIIGPSTQIYGLVETGADCRIGSSVVIGTVKSGETKPGRILIGSGVQIGDGTIVENRSELDLVIPDTAQIPALSHLTNDGNSNPLFVRA